MTQGQNRTDIGEISSRILYLLINMPLLRILIQIILLLDAYTLIYTVTQQYSFGYIAFILLLLSFYRVYLFW